MPKQLFIISLLVALTSTAWADNGPQTPEAAIERVNQQASLVNSSGSKDKAGEELRNRAIQNAALIYGAQSGRFARWQQLQGLLHQRASQLTQIFNFKLFYLENGLLQPPVLDIGANITDIAPDGQTRRLIHRVYRVLVPATFRQQPLVWQSFLIPDALRQPALPRQALLPKNGNERNLWDNYVKQGWQNGIEQANSELDVRIASLNSAYQGMYLYTLLAMKGMIEPPKVIRRSKNIDRSSDGQKMAVGEQSQAIDKKSYFIDKPNRWKPIDYGDRFILAGPTS